MQEAHHGGGGAGSLSSSMSVYQQIETLRSAIGASEALANSSTIPQDVNGVNTNQRHGNSVSNTYSNPVTTNAYYVPPTLSTNAMQAGNELATSSMRSGRQTKQATRPQPHPITNSESLSRSGLAHAVSSAAFGMTSLPNSTSTLRARPPSKFQLSDATAPVLPMSRISAPRFQAMYTTLPARMRLGTSLLMQPAVIHEDDLQMGQGAAGVAGNMLNMYGDGGQAGSGGSGAMTPTAASGVGSRRTRTAVNYADLAAFQHHEDDGVAAHSQRSRRDSTLPASAPNGFASTPGAEVEGANVGNVWGDGKSYLGQMPPGNLMTVQARAKTKHPYFSEDQLEAQARKQAVYVPVEIDLEVDGFRIRDAFVWNAKEDLVSIMDFAKIMCEDLDIPQSNAADIASQISEQTAELARASEIQVRSVEEEKEHAGRDLRVMLSLDVQVGMVRLVDRIEWDLTSSLTPEMFAKSLVRDLSLPTSALPTIAHALHSEILRAKRILEPTGLLVPIKLSSNPVVDEQVLSKRRGPKPLEGAFREWNDAGPCGPKLDLLAPEEVQKALSSKDKERKRSKREAVGYVSKRRR
ncbi:Chromatin structure remodeling complex protein sfh1 [Microbotryomycetes sp. JL221]|nr:Chromatin structure remodeling complex protein sfh1 [Microbotryomycetes sp. JL221]